MKKRIIYPMSGWTPVNLTTEHNNDLNSTKCVIKFDPCRLSNEEIEARLAEHKKLDNIAEEKRKTNELAKLDKLLATLTVNKLNNMVEERREEILELIYTYYPNHPILEAI